MKQQGKGSIVLVSSMVTRRPPALQAGYATSKGALNVAAMALADELEDFQFAVGQFIRD